MRYRADIDGLRAIAVVPVVLFHAKTRGFSGGFVGVDIFFVISGFLITGMIYEEFKQNGFSLFRFYERRARRILPALIAVIAASTIVAALLLFPSDLDLFGRSVVATSLFSSNLLFWNESGYFDATAWSKPLLHTWSLSVEEQFYIVFPIVIFLLTRYAQRWLPYILICLLATSLASCVWMTIRAPSSAFYLSPFRAWEFLIGSLLAVRGASMPRGHSIIREAAVVAGLALIIWAIVTYSQSTQFPGLRAIPPCLGAALIIYAGQSGTTLVGRALMLRPVVAIGTISYSLYLWHWAILVFTRYVSQDYLSPIATAAAIAGSFACAAVSWKFIEQPVRSRSVFQTRRSVFKASLFATSVISAVGLLVLASGGGAWLYPKKVRTILAYANYAYEAPYRSSKCFLHPQNTFADYQTTECATADHRKNLLLVGDSYAADLWFGLSNQSNSTANIMQATASGCHPILAGAGPWPACKPLKAYVFGDLAMRATTDVVLLSAQWQESDLASLDQTIDLLHGAGKKAVIFGPIVEYRRPLADILGVGLAEGRHDLAEEYRIDNSHLDDQMRELARAKSTTYVSLYRMFCPTDTCITFATPTVPAQWDRGHLTAEGSMWVADQVRKSGLLTY